MGAATLATLTSEESFRDSVSLRRRLKRQRKMLLLLLRVKRARSTKASTAKENQTGRVNFGLRTVTCTKANLLMDFFTVGERLFSNGDRYDGEFSRGAFNENGVYTWKNGNCYVGKWKNNKMHGPGAFSDGEEVFILCEYNNGKRIREEKKGELPEALKQHRKRMQDSLKQHNAQSIKLQSSSSMKISKMYKEFGEANLFKNVLFEVTIGAKSESRRTDYFQRSPQLRINDAAAIRGRLVNFIQE